MIVFVFLAPFALPACALIAAGFIENRRDRDLRACCPICTPKSSTYAVTGCAAWSGGLVPNEQVATSWVHRPAPMRLAPAHGAGQLVLVRDGDRGATRSLVNTRAN